MDWEAPNADERIAAFLKRNLESGRSSGETLSEKEKWDRQSHFMVDAIANANAKCDIPKSAPISADWDRASFAKEDEQKRSFNGYCGAVFDRLNVMCRDTPAARKLVQKKIHRVVCRYGGKGKFALSLAKGTLTYTIDWEASQADERIEAFLKKSL